MKKVLCAIVFVMIFGSLFAQETLSGNISFIFDKTKFEIPIQNVSIRKHEKIFVEVNGKLESEIGVGIKNVSLRFSLKSLSPQKILIKDFAMNISSNHEFKFSIQAENAHFSTLTERFNYQDVSTFFSIDKILYKNGKIQITGSFSGTYSNITGRAKDVSKFEIKNGKFEMIF